MTGRGVQALSWARAGAGCPVLPGLLADMKAGLAAGCMVGMLVATSPAVAATPNGLPYTPGLDVKAMDRNVDACTDFYQHACGGWIKANPIPPDQTGWSVYRKLAEQNAVLLRRILEQAARSRGPDAVTRQIGDHYAACMDESLANRLGARPLAAELAAISALRSVADLAPLLARLQRHAPGEQGLLFGVGSQQDPDDATQQIATIDQAGLGLPDRDDYVRDDEESRRTRDRYHLHISRVLRQLGRSPPQATEGATSILRLETALAHASQSLVERRDPYATTHKLAWPAVAALAPELDWATWRAALAAPLASPAPLAQPGLVNVASPGFFTALSAGLRAEPLVVWQDYLRYHLADQRASTLSRAFVQEDFDFHRRFLRGAKAIQPRWKRCVQRVDAQLGEALGQAYVGQVFKPETKTAVVDMVQRIEDAMAQRLQTLDWMSEPTRQAALAKLHAVRNKIGYPERWRDYGAVAIRRDDPAGNAVRAAAFEFNRQLAKVGQPVDRGEWGMTPPTVNAYYNAAMNDINFPAAVLQPPLYDPAMDAAPNYGNTGATIGHELTHGFDDEGRQYDGQGNLKDWWTPEDARRFTQRAQCIADQYSGYEVIGGQKINGALTLGEDVADLGGQILAYEAWRQAVQGQNLPQRDGLTPDQRFFVGMAQWACASIRPEQARRLLKTDPHSPPRFLINGVVVNMPEFARAFACPVGSPMTKPADKVCRVW